MNPSTKLRAAWQLSLLALLCLWAAACREPATPDASSPPSDAGGHAHAVATPAGKEGKTPAERDHRDPHGPPRLDRYIEALSSAERTAELRPDEIAASLALAPDAIVADLGCGPGVLALPLARAVPDGFVFAIDVEPGQLDALRERIAAEGVDNIVPVLASYGDPHLPPGKVDCIVIADTYHHIEDRVAYLARLARALKPKGRLAIVEYLPGDIPVGPAASHKLAAGVREAELAAAGFRLDRRFEIHEWHDFEVWSFGTAQGGL